MDSPVPSRLAYPRGIAKLGQCGLPAWRLLRTAGTGIPSVNTLAGRLWLRGNQFLETPVAEAQAPPRSQGKSCRRH
jgi:hypothetical protein